MYSNVDYSWGKNLLIALFFTLSFICTNVFAGAAEDRTDSIYDAALKKRNGLGVSNVRATNDGIYADTTQRVTVDGSSATVKQKVHIPANDPFYKNAAKYGGKMVRGGLAGGALGVAVDGILDATDWLIENGKIVNKLPNENDLASDNNAFSHLDYYWKQQGTTQQKYYSSVQAACKGYAGSSATITSVKEDGSRGMCSFSYSDSVRTDVFVAARVANPRYNPDALPPSRPQVSDNDFDDAFGDWLKNNPSSITDPVMTYIYSGKDSNNQIADIPPDGTPNFGGREITDEMMDNYLEHRNNALFEGKLHNTGPAANPAPENKPEINDSTKPETDTAPKPSTEVEVLPDGTRIQTDTTVRIDPETGEEIVTKTTTTTKPDGSSTTSTKTTTKPSPSTTTTDLPAACEYLAFLCDFVEWIKKDDVNDDSVDDLTEITPELGNLDTSTFNASAGCPSPETFSINGKTIEISYEPICTFASNWSFVAPLIASFSAALIVIGVGRKGEDSDT